MVQPPCCVDVDLPVPTVGCGSSRSLGLGLGIVHDIESDRTVLEWFSTCTVCTRLLGTVSTCTVQYVAGSVAV